MNGAIASHRDQLTLELARRIVCEIVPRWGLDPSFAGRVALVVIDFQRETHGELRIISGFRDLEKQQELITIGTGAPADVSNHTLCPAHAVDVWPTIVPTASVRWTLGRIVLENGLRWGGCDPTTPGCIDEDTGIPQDWNHIDDGPRWQKGR